MWCFASWGSSHTHNAPCYCLLSRDRFITRMTLNPVKATQTCGSLCLNGYVDVMNDHVSNEQTDVSFNQNLLPNLLDWQQIDLNFYRKHNVYASHGCFCSREQLDHISHEINGRNFNWNCCTYCQALRRTTNPEALPQLKIARLTAAISVCTKTCFGFFIDQRLWLRLNYLNSPLWRREVLANENK